MAFEQINKYTDILAERYQKSGNSELLTIMTMYYETVLQMAKFKGQRQYFKIVLHRICPGYFKGYFKKDTPY